MSDLTISPVTGTGSGDSVKKTFTQTAHGLSVQNAVGTDSSGNWIKADASDIAKLGIGIVSAVADANTVEVTFEGYISGLSGLTADQYYFVSSSTPGSLTTTEPSNPNYSNPLLLALSTTTGVVLPFRPSAPNAATSSAPASAQYVTLATDGTLSAERVLTGTSNQITVTDNGAGSTVVLSTPQNIATSSSPTFAGLTLSSPLTVANGGTGASTLTANNVILGNGTSAVAFVAPSTSGNVLTSNGTTWQSTAPSGGATFYARSTDLTRTSTDTLSADTVLTHSTTWVGSAMYVVQGTLFIISTSGTPEFAFQFNGPTADTVNIGFVASRAGTTANTLVDRVTAFATGGTGGSTVDLNANVAAFVNFSGSFLTNATPGSTAFSLEWAQGTSNATGTTLLTGSWMSIKKV
jgi:hypothetical protein